MIEFSLLNKNPSRWTWADCYGTLWWQRLRKRSVLLCPVWPPAQGQKAEIVGAEIKPMVSVSSIRMHCLSWPGGRGPFSKLHNSTLWGQSWWFKVAFQSRCFCVAGRKNKDDKPLLRVLATSWNRTTSAFVPLFSTQDTWPLQGRLGSVVFILGCYVDSRNSRIKARIHTWERLNISATPPANRVRP